MLHNKRVAILGGSRGIGFAVAQGAVHEGAHVIIASSQQENVAGAITRLPEGTATGAVVDIRSMESLSAFFSTLGAFDHLVFTAGEPLPFGKPVVEIDLATARSFFELRYWGAVAAVKAAQPHMRDGGSIVLTSGTSARRPPAGFAFAASICGAIESLTRALALDLAPLRVNVVTPGMVATDLWSGIPSEARDQIFRSVGGKLPVGRVGEPSDIAEAYLSFMRNAYVTGQSVIVDGGAVLV
ncbi:NAD(P)-dependent dehydrogenase (short-subunit alcohol dehydrogenase family) [Rhizobium sp. ERR 922]|uniref:SDR family oxidoreductase n=1 Tax=unclassified Rhizobium TaxID=2613769 RepID=UPI00119E37D3|nr:MULTISPECIES: SDR family oxidoreductase [unclassified Rhizobium]TWB50024.1 NAD(P)-dependent dehydrogenase (short-subunit alcohol dehydrogenase family) [Rhizobium sp. ERR 922]TWB92405.1 NAD(P)-dependent dehydrogenase (short-subunit alcohol dehydrogenase family) [Rhizobium sp. ERR 942]